MAFGIKLLVDRFLGRAAALPSVDILASTPSPADSLENRLNWLVDLVQWIRRPGKEDAAAPPAGSNLQAGRLRRFFDVLDRNPEWKLRVAATLRSIVRETTALDLFAETGLPRQVSLFHEAAERMSLKFLPPPPDTAELGVIFDRLFPHAGDQAWIARLDETTLQRLCDLVEYEVAESERGWNVLAADLEDALVHLTAQLRVSGCSAAIRLRVKNRRMRESPFFKLNTVVQAVLAAKERDDKAALEAELNYLRQLMEGCHRVVEEVHEHLEGHGVSTEVVYQLAVIEASLQRLDALLDLAFNPHRSLGRVAAFVATLVRENQARESVVDLLRQNFRLLTRKLVERNAQTGEHYITRTREEYWAMVGHAAGGGALTGLTTWFKFVIVVWTLPEFLKGLAASANYAGSFVAMQLCGFTLATKQPANTAPALADRMHQVRDPVALEKLVDEVVCLIRTQVAAVMGNILMVVPAVLLLHLLLLIFAGKPMLTPEKAEYTLHSVSLLGPSAFYAAWTGVLLWASSIAAAWADNWFVSHRIGAALAADRRLLRVLGTTRATNLARFLSRNMAGLGGNISLGIMLGLVPVVAHFVGLPLDIRHVTLSSGSIAAAVASLGAPMVATPAFWLAVTGTMVIGLMNLAVSFSLAMFVAIRARGVQAPERSIIYQALLARLRRDPRSFVLPG